MTHMHGELPPDGPPDVTCEDCGHDYCGWFACPECAKAAPPECMACTDPKYLGEHRQDCARTNANVIPKKPKAPEPKCPTCGKTTEFSGMGLPHYCSDECTPQIVELPVPGSGPKKLWCALCGNWFPAEQCSTLTGPGCPKCPPASEEPPSKHLMTFFCIVCKSSWRGVAGSECPRCPTDDPAHTGLKYDGGKPPLDLIPTEAELLEAAVLAYGAKTYKENSWQKVRPGCRYIAAALRHINAYRAGEDLDKESGLPHLAHARCNLGFAIGLEAEGVSCRRSKPS